MCTIAATGLALILLFGQQTVYQFVKLFSFFLSTVTRLQTFWIPNKFNLNLPLQVFFKAFTLYISE